MILDKGKKQTRRKTKAPAAPRRPETAAAAPNPVTAKPAAVPRVAQPAPHSLAISPEERCRMISDAAYFRAQRRGFRGGDPSRDWIEAEAEIDAMLLNRR